MEIQVLKSKLHCVTVTQAELDYIGSITIDEDLMDAANLIENEQVHILNKNNGERFITYVIKRAIGEVKYYLFERSGGLAGKGIRRRSHRSFIRLYGFRRGKIF